MHCIPFIKCQYTWTINRRETGDVILDIPAPFKCGEVVSDWSLDVTTGECRCNQETPTFFVYKDGSFGCIRSMLACQGRL